MVDKPGFIVTEFIAQTLRYWLKLVGVGTLYIEPGSPWENGYAESFHGRFRDEFLAIEIFESIRGRPDAYCCLEGRIQHPATSQLVGLSDSGRVLRRVCGWGKAICS